MDLHDSSSSVPNTENGDVKKESHESKLNLHEKGAIELISNAANEMVNDPQGQNPISVPDMERAKFRTIPPPRTGSMKQQEKIAEPIKARWFMDPVGFTRCTQSPDFCQKLLWSNDSRSNTVVIMLASPTGLQILSCWGKYIMVDEPISTEEYTLTVILGPSPVTGIVVPAAYFLHNRKGEDIYRKMWQMLKEKTPTISAPFEPNFILCSFDDAMRNSLQMEFRGSIVMGSSFHLVQASQRFLMKHQKMELVEYVSRSLYVLWADNSAENFSMHLGDFLGNMKSKLESYWHWFQQEWGIHHPPTTWTFFSRPTGSPMDDDLIEDYHSTILQIFHGKGHVTLAEMYDLLHDEYVRQYQIFLNPQYMFDKVTLQEQRKRQRGLGMLAALPMDTTGMAMAAASINSIADTSTRIPQDSGLSVVDPSVKNEDMDDMSLDGSIGDGSPFLTCPAPCGQTRNLNKQCSLRKCKACCSKDVSWCKVYDHRQSKMPLCKDLPNFPIVDEAIRKKLQLWITYDDEKTRVISEKKLSNLSWEIEPFRFSGVEISGKDSGKIYRLDRVKTASLSPPTFS